MNITMYEGFKKRLEEAKDSSKKVKVLFQLPKSYRITIKSGLVISYDDDTFTIDERDDGVVAYSYKYLIEVASIKDNKGIKGGEKHGG